MKSKYDVIVIGGGLGGLTAGAFLAKAGKSVLLCEREPKTGGCATSFEREGFIFDAGVHFVLGAGEEGNAGRILSSLGVKVDINFVERNPMYRCVFPEHKFDVSLSKEEWIETLSSYFPDERMGLNRIFEDMEELYEEMYSVPLELSFADKAMFPLNYPFLVNYSNKTFQDMMDEFIRNPLLKSIFSSLWLFLGCPPHRVSSVYMSGLLMTCFKERAFYPVGGVERLSFVLTEGLKKNGGEILLNAEVVKILLKGNRIVGIELKGGEKIGCDYLISNIDARRTYLEMIGENYIKGRLKKDLREMVPSMSLCQVHLGVALENDEISKLSHQTFIFDTYDMKEIYQRIKEGNPKSPLAIAIPSIGVPKLAPPGRHCITLLSYYPYNLSSNWEKDRERIEKRMIEKASSFIPNLEQRILVREFSSPKDIERFTGASYGAPYGWDFTPNQVGANRLPSVTCFENLFLAGHWTVPGGGTSTVMYSGKCAAELILKREERKKRNVFKQEELQTASVKG